MGDRRRLTTTVDDVQRESPATRSTDDVVLELDDVAKRYGEEPVVSDLSLSVRDGEILTLLGPSGCGKTTTLRLVVGLEKPNRGGIRLRDDPVATMSTDSPSSTTEPPSTCSSDPTT